MVTLRSVCRDSEQWSLSNRIQQLLRWDKIRSSIAIVYRVVHLADEMLFTIAPMIFTILFIPFAAVAAGGAVSTTNTLATAVGQSVLDDGGNFADAAAAVQLALAVVEPQFVSIAGGTNMMLRHAGTGAVHNLDGREEAPAAYHPGIFCKGDCMRPGPRCTCAAGAWNDTEQCTGSNAFGTPGVVAAVARLVATFGTWTLPRVAAPAIRLAGQGFPMYQDLHDMVVANAPRLHRYPATAALFLADPGNASSAVPRVAVGETFANPDLAATLQDIFGDADGAGVVDFYNGTLAGEIVAAQGTGPANGGGNPVTGKWGLVSRADLASYRAVFREPVASAYRYRNYSACAHGGGRADGCDTVRSVALFGSAMPYSGGATLALALNVLSAVLVGGAGGANGTGAAANASRQIGLLLDAQNAAFADRDAWMADADFVDVPTAGMISPAYADARAAALFNASFAPGRNRAVQTPIAAGNPWKYQPTSGVAPPVDWAVSRGLEHGTSHFSIVDADGNVAATTTTVNHFFGTRVVVPGRGFLLNNELCDFDPLPADKNGKLYANAPAGGKKPRRTAIGPGDAASLGGKRPRSSQTPTIVVGAGLGGGGGGGGGGAGASAVLGLGSPGGSSITGGVVNVLHHLLNRGETDLQGAVNAPRAVGKNVVDNNVTYFSEGTIAVRKTEEHTSGTVEPALKAAVASAFTAWRYNVSAPASGPPYTAFGGDGGFHAFGCVQAAASDGKTWWAAADFSRDREAASAAW